MLLSSAQVLGGLLLLAISADRLVVAAARISRGVGMSPVLVGALVVGMGTSAPELLVGVLASLRGELDLAVGNVVGSNVANVTLVLGASALVRPIIGQPGVLPREGILALLGAGALTGFLWDGELSRPDGGLLLAAMVGSAVALVWWARTDERRRAQVESEAAQLQDSGTSLVREGVWGLACLGSTLLGAELLVGGGQAMATHFGLTTAFVGMTLVAVGTSLPELATSLAGARRGEHGLVVGNILGSNLFNTFAVAGLSVLVGPGAVVREFRVAAVAMVGAAAIAGFFALTGQRVARWEGGLLLAAFGGFLVLIT